MFDTPADAHQRLHESVLLYLGEPTYVRHYDGMEFTGRDLITGVTFTFDCNEAIKQKKLIPCAFDLGYINYQQKAQYISRVPKRKFKAGIDTTNTFITNITPDGVKCKAISIELIRSSIFGYMIKNMYPPIEEAIDQIHEVESIAIGRRTKIFADEIGIIKFDYMQKTVGWINKHRKMCIPEHLTLESYVIRKELEANNRQVEIVGV